MRADQRKSAQALIAEENASHWHVVFFLKSRHSIVKKDFSPKTSIYPEKSRTLLRHPDIQIFCTPGNRRIAPHGMECLSWNDVHKIYEGLGAKNDAPLACVPLDAPTRQACRMISSFFFIWI